MFLEKADTSHSDQLLARLAGMSDEEAGIDAAFLARACAAHGLPALPVARAGTQGTFHRLYHVAEPRDRPSLLRVCVFAGPDGGALMALESRLVDRLRGASVPVPDSSTRPVADGDTVRGTQVTRRADGVTMRSLDADEIRVCAVLATTAQLLRSAHQLHGDGYGPLSVLAGAALSGLHQSWDDYLRTRLSCHVQACQKAGVITDQEASTIARHFDEAVVDPDPAGGRLLHGDPGGHNVLVQEDRVSALIDWEDALLGDPIFDIASLCCFHPERRHPVVFRTLDLAMAPGTDIWRRFWLYFLRIALARTVHRLRFAYPERPGRLASRRIQLALARLAGEPVAA